MLKKFFTWFLIFIGIYLILQSFRSPIQEAGKVSEDVTLKTTQQSYYPGDPVIVNVVNNLDQALRVPSDCPAEPLTVERYSNGVWNHIEAKQGLFVSCDLSSNTPPQQVTYLHELDVFVLSPRVTTMIDYSPWKAELFSELGKYRLTLDLTIGETKKSFSTDFEVIDHGFFSSVTTQLFFRPIYNFMLFLTTIVPGHNFGLAVIALTILIRLLLLVPNQRALKSQRSMLRLQPELDSIKRKHKGDQQRISQETMALWKQHRVNPIGGCLPLLIQLPILIALFYVVRTGFTPYQGHLTYSFLSSIDLTKISSDFFSILNLQKVNATWLPVIVGLLQFLQMKLSFSQKKKSIDQNHTQVQDAAVVVDGVPEKKAHNVDELQDPLKMMNKTMVYFMPVMIGFMVASLPSGVGLYLAVSTLFGIAQQYSVNRLIN